LAATASASTQDLQAVAEEIAEVVRAGIEVCVVVGGGNIFRGAALAEAGLERTSADYMGMLATVMNAIAVQAALEKIGVFTRVHRRSRWRRLRALHPASRLRHLERAGW